MDDLVSSIIGSMDNPPTRDKKYHDIYKNQKKEYENIKNHQREELNRFRQYVEERLGRLLKDDNRHYMEFQPLDQVYRSIVHDVSETAGLSGMSFGVEAERYIVVYKKEHLPCEDELNARKNGEIWNKQTARQYAERRMEHKQLKDKMGHSEVTNFKPYLQKSRNKEIHFISQDATTGKTKVNRAYGYVPSENKKDVRSIEQTMADIQAKKKLKTQHQEASEEQ